MGRQALQGSFEGQAFKLRFESGGALNKNSNPKEARPISTKKAMHVVLRSDLAKGPWDLRRHDKKIHQIIYKQAEKFRVTVYQLANVGNHIHLLIYLQANSYTYAKKCLSGFLRAIAGLITRSVLGVQRGAAKGLKFWTYRPYTRVVEGFVRGYKIVKDYVIRNQLEARGIIPYQARKTKQPGFRQKFSIKPKPILMSTSPPTSALTNSKSMT